MKAKGHGNMFRQFGRMAVSAVSVLALASGAIAAGGSPAFAAGTTPSDLADLVGARGSSGEGQLLARGYALHHASQTENSSITYWWNSAAKKCVRVTTSDGRYAAIRSESGAECGHKSNDSAAAAAIGAAALLGVVALASKSHHREDRYTDAASTAEFERGYRDGLYNQSYHNYGRSDGYSHGYEQGVRQRGHETSYRPGYFPGGGYSAYVPVNDLVGRSTSGVRSDLSGRGFVLRDDLSPGGEGHVRTYWREASEQCIVVHSRGGTVMSIDSARKRNCR